VWLQDLDLPVNCPHAPCAAGFCLFPPSIPFLTLAFFSRLSNQTLQSKSYRGYLVPTSEGKKLETRRPQL
jgi:hypothetical protein